MKTAKKLEALFVMLDMLVAAVLITSCCSDCPTGPADPAAYKGWLYATDIDTYYLYRIDTETDSVVDSMHCELGEYYMPGRPTCSSDGKYLAVSYGDNLNEQYLLRLFNAQTWELISEVYDPINPLFFVKNNSLLLTRVGNEFIYYSVPDLIPVYSDSMIFSHPNLYRLDMLQVDDSKNLAYIIARFNLDYQPNNYIDSVCLYAYNYTQKRIENEWVINIRTNDGNFFVVTQASLDANKSRIYVNTSGPDGFYAVGYDYGKGQVLFMNRIESCYGDIALTPNKKEVYVVDPGLLGDMSTAGTLYIYDAETGAYVHGISLYGFTPNRPDIPMYASVIAFTPTGNKAYIGSGHNDKWSGTICSINTSTYAVENLVWPDFGHLPYRLIVGPK